MDNIYWPALYAAISVTYGNPNPGYTFRVPNLKGNTGTGLDTSADEAGRPTENTGSSTTGITINDAGSSAAGCSSYYLSINMLCMFILRCIRTDIPITIYNHI